MRISRFSFKYLFLLLLSFAGPKINAQIRLAAYGGVHSANVIENNSLPGWDTAVKNYYSSRSGFQLGVLAEIPVGKKGFYFQPGINYSSKGRNYEKFYDTSGISKDTLYWQSSLKLGYIELPLYMTYKIPLSANHKNSFFISAGPYFSFFYNGKMSLQNRVIPYNSSKYVYTSEDQDLEVGNAPGKYKTIDLGINARAGFEFGSVFLNAYFSRGLTNFYTASYDASFHHQLVGASLGIWLSKAATPIPVKIKKDSDKDGINDEEDACPLQAGTIAWHGCPVPDTDHDGIDDEHDSCKTVAGLARYHGCPVPDTDGDGIDDEQDSCKTIAGTAIYHGCPIPDTDKDGVNDEADKCPDQPGSAENQGCPVVRKEIIEKVAFQAHAVLFESSSNRLTKSSYQALDELSDTLRTNPELHLTIAGHTDSTGIPAHNLLLSKQRADAVKNYLLKKGIATNRISTIGYGQERPIADNKTPEGKAINRRVEFKLDIQQ
jgi:outer membrane protein OmpA-like peptidoglycan-associated protein